MSATTSVGVGFSLTEDLTFGASGCFAKHPTYASITFSSHQTAALQRLVKDIYGEFDPGSGRTLAACL
ncbi:MAG: hypothetical protein ABJC62_13965, partial [Frankiaceae bacterium]